MRLLITISLLLILAGLCNGVHETLNHHYSTCTVCPQEGERGYNFWAPKVSHVRKWKDGKKENGDAFPGSSTILVFVTDGYHLTKFLYHGFLRAALVVLGIAFYSEAFGWSRRRRWGYGVLAWFTLAGIQALGFHLTYSIILV